MTKREHVPETRASKPNREQRRHPEQQGVAVPDGQTPPTGEKVAGEVPPEVASVRATSSGHKKKTADKWNQ